MPSFFKKLISTLTGGPQYRDLERARFVSQWEPLVKAARAASNKEPEQLPLDLTPGFLCSGFLGKVIRSQQAYGEVCVGEDKRLDEDCIALHLQLYPRGDTSSQQVRGKAEPYLKSLYYEIVKRALKEEETDRDAGFVAMRLLARLKAKTRPSRLDESFLDFLENAPIFPCFQQIYPDIPGHPIPEPTPRLLPLQTLKQARLLYLGPEDTGPMQDTIDMDEEGQLNFEVSQAMVAITELYNLPVQYATVNLERRWSPSTAPPSPPPPPRDPDEVLAEKLHDRSVRARFGDAQLQNHRWVVPGEPALEFDFRQGGVRGRTLSGQLCEWPLSELTSVRRLEREVWGDTKIHQYRYLLLQRGQETMVYFERLKQYFESSPLDDLDRYQDRARRVLELLSELDSSHPLTTLRQLESI